jgi:hypothetical protein
MIVKTRKTLTGTEYWDAKEKRVRFVSAGQEPNFVVTVNPKSMIVGVDLANGLDKTVINGEVLNDEDMINFSEMTVSELKKFATDHGIEIPADRKKKDDIISFLTEETE